MKIVHIASEVFPYMKTGGLADVVGALSSTQADSGHEVSVIIPGYRLAMSHPDALQSERRLRLKIEMGEKFISGDVRVFSPKRNLSIYLICRDEFFDRRNPYGNGERDYEDNAERFIFFAKSAVEAIRLLDLQPDIVHSHDWQASLAPIFLRFSERRYGLTLAIKTILTIHNIAYQGLFPSAVFELTNLPRELNSVDGLEYYGQVNLLKGGILFADQVTTVSPRYAKEIQTTEFGFGLDGVVLSRSEGIIGLINGVDTQVWNPKTDTLIPARFSSNDLKGKATCRTALLRVAGFNPQFTGPLYGIVCRLVEQKGMDLLLENEEFFLKQNCRLVILGSGDQKIEARIRELQNQAPDKVFLNPKLDEAMSHLIEAGSDFFVMPSLFEPCGLNQMYSQIYGTVPIVSRVGGLVDTVIDIDEYATRGTGITHEPNAESLRAALKRSLVLFADKATYQEVQKRGMQTDFSWKKATLGYEKLYSDAL
ncbi:MAG: glycogen synthase GlgA [Verrucomicrobiota bacterium]|jgi:starch synthase